MKEKFVQFLKDEGVYEKFMRNFENDPDNPKGFDYYFKHAKPFSYISRAFMWCETPEWEKDNMFWATIGNRWKVYLKEYEKNMPSLPADEKAEESCDDLEEEPPLKMVKTALIEAKKLLDFYIDSTDDLDGEQIESVRHFVKALNAGCSCDDYHGFDCGCGERAFLCKEALKELDGLEDS